MEGQVSACDAGADTLELAWTLKPPPGLHPPTDAPEVEPGNVPRISRLVALAIKFDDLIRRGEVEDYATLARFGHVTRARITQIMALLNLAPDIQEAILFLPRTLRGHDSVTERHIRAIAGIAEWHRQREAWQRDFPPRNGRSGTGDASPQTAGAPGRAYARPAPVESVLLRPST